MSCPKRPRSQSGSPTSAAFLSYVIAPPTLLSKSGNLCPTRLMPRMSSIVAPRLRLWNEKPAHPMDSSAPQNPQALITNGPVSPQNPDTTASLPCAKPDMELPKPAPVDAVKVTLPIPEEAKKQPQKVPRKRVVSLETRRKISYTMLGQRRSDQMRAKVSKKLKGRVPWNKGKKLSPETRARMSEARVGRNAWNKGRTLSFQHRHAISKASLSVARRASPDTLRRMRMARRRPGDALLSGRSGAHHVEVGSYPLMGSEDINNYVTLRRELRVWSDKFMHRNSKRPSLADIRRVAPPHMVRKFEKYVEMRDQIRGLASDVYGSVNPADVPVVSVGDISDVPRNNNAKTVIRVTKHGNRRMVDAEGRIPGNGQYRVHSDSLEGCTEDMWDMYDRPASPTENSATCAVDNSLVGTHELNAKRKDQLSANDYRMIGKYRLMESADIYRYVKLRKELQQYSAEFKERHGRIPKLSDVKNAGKSIWHSRFCHYLAIRQRMGGLVSEVYQTDVDDVETFRKVNVEGRVILDSLRSGRSHDDCEEPSGSTS